MKIKWDPVLPSEQVDAMNALQYARIAKFPFVFKEKFWKEENFDMITDTPAHYFYHATKDQGGKSGVLISYVTGDKVDSMASMTKDQRQNIVLDALKPAFGDVRKYLSDSLMYYWGTDPYSRGAYAFYGKGQWFESCLCYVSRSKRSISPENISPTGKGLWRAPSIPQKKPLSKSWVNPI